MKKVFLLLAFVAVYGISMAMSGTSVVVAVDSQVAFETEIVDNNVAAPEGEKEKAKEAKAAKGEGCATAKSEGCSTAKAAGCGDKEKSASADTKGGTKK